MNGWIKIYRQSLNSSVWENPKVWFVWCWCLMKANHQPTEFPFNGKDIRLLTGEFLTGRDRAIAELPGISSQSWRTAITYLKSTNRITTKVTNKFTIISICKWEDYQGKVTSEVTSNLTNQQPTSNQPVTTYKKNKKLIIKERYRSSNFSSIKNLTPEVIKSIADQYSVELKDVEDLKESLILYCQSKGKVYRNYKAALQEWVRRRIREKSITIINKGDKNDPLTRHFLERSQNL